MKSARAAGLDITRGSFAGGEHAYEYLDDWHCKLFLSASRGNVQKVLAAGHAAALVFDLPEKFVPIENQVRIAFDGDAVILTRLRRKFMSSRICQHSSAMRPSTRMNRWEQGR